MRLINARLDEPDHDIAFWRPRAFAGHILTAALGALVTIAAGLNTASWQVPHWRWLGPLFHRQNVILVLGAAITIISAWQTFYNHRARWVGYASAAERLRALAARVEYSSPTGAPETP